MAGVYYFRDMHKRFIIILLAVVFMLIVMRLQGQSLVSPVSSLGILDLEFAKTEERLQQLLIFWNTKDIYTNIFLDFFFIAAYTWFFLEAFKMLQLENNPTFFSVLVIITLLAAILDVAENLLMLVVIKQAATSTLTVIYWIAIIKFLSAGLVLLILFYSALYRYFFQKILNRNKT
jgi:hypothetical protein